ncbi:sulfurtransferase-like selenium metabolism protein YedF [Desulfonema magnum]|uniref:SirA family protein, TusA domain-containing n=1 Tax=Desulfonema magnum TaxID=45655 RepID=A0A975BGQ7_9BACT|nr:sulfurtransferase-like selenium metabolism protein YedF [Desulfonema magnum]QTA84998.1 SirA family protein, TusA domain-containing [Desulfonema magnum]
MKEIDARGLACPAPVLLTKTAIEKEQASHIRVIVDNKASKENVCLFLSSKNFESSVEEKHGDFYITAKGEGGTGPEAAPVEKADPGGKKIMVMVATDRMGYGDDELGLKLMISFIKTLKEMGSDLWRLVFVNNGVKLTVEGAEVLPDVKELEADGIHILVCGTCLSHFNLLDQKQVGETTNMLDIVTAMQLADKVINI